METLNKKELIISLIRDNLINLKLVSGLNHMGLIADDYYLHLGDTIFMGNSEKISQVSISSSLDELNLLSMEIYKELLFARGISDPN